MNSAVNNKRVFCVAPHRPIGYGEMLGKRGDIRLDMLAQDVPGGAALDVLSAAHAYQISSARDELARHYHVSGELLNRTPNLLIVSTNGAGYDTVTVRDCTENGVLVVNQAGGNAESVAEHVLGMMLCLVKRIGECDRALRTGRLEDRNKYTGNEVFGRTIGIIGLGNVGRRVAQLCGTLFNMQVLAYDPYVSAEEIRARGATKVELDDLLRRADVVSVNCPLTDETRKMISAREYAVMQPHAYFITTARGFIHDEEALDQALRDKKIAGAGLDTFDVEPLPLDHPLRKMDNVVITPHLGYVSDQNYQHYFAGVVEDIRSFLDGKPIRVMT
jgi:D-3-phosphoglycerate dehydrogenase